MKRIIVELFLVLAAIAAVSRMFFLGIPQTAIVGFFGLFLLPVADRYRMRARMSEQEFYDVTAYMEQFLCSYKRAPVIGNALRDCQSIFAEGTQMWQILEKMQTILQTGEEVQNNTEDILHSVFWVMEQRYPGRRLVLLHGFIQKADQMGGNTSESLDLLLRDFHMWKRRVLVFRKRKQYAQSEGILACVLALGMCGLSYLLIPWNLREMLTISTYYQWSAAAVTLAVMFVLLWIQSKMAESWLGGGGAGYEKRQEELEKKYFRIKKGKRTLFYPLSWNVCRREIEREFPYWLLTVTLFLQQDNVFQAVRSSMGHVAGIFRNEVRKFLREIYEDPVSLRPYNAFFEEFQLPEVQSGMKLLYAFASNGYEDTSRQIRFLVEQSQLVIDQAERNACEERMAAFGYVRQIPMIFAAMKVVLDLILLLMAMFGKYFFERQGVV